MTARKEGGEIFIRNLPYDAQAEDLEQLCSEVGPVKRAAVIQSDGRSRGFGFVKFALAEDASRAVSVLHGSKFRSRVLRVELALKKGHKPEGVVVAAAAAKKPREEPQAAGKPERVAKEKKPRTVLLFNLADTTTEKQLYKRVKKTQPPTSLRIETVNGERAAVAVFQHPSAAEDVQKKLDKHVIHGREVSARLLQVPGEGPASRDKRRKVEASGSLKESGLDSVLVAGARKQARVIVRNLSFKATEEDLKSALSTFGPILEVAVPGVDLQGVRSRRGFGFVTFTYEQDARSAAEYSDPIAVCGREVAVDLCLGRREYQQGKGQQQQESVNHDVNAKAQQALPDGGEENNEANPEQEEEEEDDDKEVEEDGDDDEADDDDEEEEEEEGGQSVESDGEEARSDGQGDGVTSSEDEECNSAAGDVKAAERVPRQDVQEGKTLFVRNIPFDASSDQLRTAFSMFGPVIFAALVKDRDTGALKGSAFVKFKSIKAVDAVLEAAKAEGGTLMLLGRRLKVERAVGKDEVAGQSAATDRPRSRVDRRNLYLLNEGLVVNASEGEVPKLDLEKRRREQAEKKARLRNPLFFVSPTRLAIRNLGRAVTDEELRTVVVEGVRRGLQDNKVTEEDLRLHAQAAGKAEGQVQVPRAAGGAVRVKVKVVRDLDKPPLQGVYPSRGFAFADFATHAHALAALRHLNNNPAYSRLAAGPHSPHSKPRLIVSFAVENKVKVKQKATRQDKDAVVEAGRGSSTDKRKSRGARQREKRKLQQVGSATEEGKPPASSQQQQAGPRRKVVESRKRAVDVEPEVAGAVKPGKKRRVTSADDEAFARAVSKHKQALLGASNVLEAERRSKRWFE